MAYLKHESRIILIYFPVEPRVAIGSAQNEAEIGYEVSNVFQRFQAQMAKLRKFLRFSDLRPS